MAIIGSINVLMSADASKFTSGLAAAHRSLTSFAAAASKISVGGGVGNIGAGFGQIGTGLAIAASMVKANAGIIASNLRGMAPKMFAPLALAAASAARASVDALANTYGGLGRRIGGVLSKVGSPIGAAFKASVGSLQAIYGPMLAPIGKAFGAVFKGTDFKMLSGPLGVMASGLGKVALGATQAGIGLAKMGLKATVAGVRGVTSTVSSMGLKLGVAGGLGAYGLYKVVKAGSDLIESQNLVKEVFKGSSGTVIMAADQMAAAFGVSKTEFLTAAGRMGGIFKGAGFTEQAAADLSVQFTKLSGDVSSFFNLPIEEASEKLRAGLVGQIRPLRDLGVNIDDDMVKANAYATGIAQLGTELTANQKVQSRITLITKGLADAHGDLARTANEVSNRMREAWGRIGGFVTTVGVALQPIAKNVLGQISVAVDAMGLAWQANQAAVMDWVNSIIGGGAAAADSMGIVQAAVGYLADSWQQMGVWFAEAQLGITTGLLEMFKGVMNLVRGISGLTILFSPEKTMAANNIYNAMLIDLRMLQTEQQRLLTGKKAAAPFSESVNKYFTKAKANAQAARDAVTFGGGGMASIGGGLIGGGLGKLGGIFDTTRTAGLLGGGLANVASMLTTSLGAPTSVASKSQPSGILDQMQAAGLVGGGLGSIAGGLKPVKASGEFKYASAAAAGSSEAANAILKSKYGEGSPKTQEAAVKTTAKNTTTMAKGIDDLVRVTTKLYGDLRPFEIDDLGAG